MKRISYLGGLAVVTAMVLSSCNNQGNKSAAQPATSVVSAPATAVSGKIAYVDLDTLEFKYELLKTKREDFKRRQEQMENELQGSYQKMQSDADEVQKKAQANTLTQSEYESAQKRLSQMAQSLETRKQALTDQLVKEQDDFNKDLRTRLDAFLAEYNKTHQFDYILSYSASGSSILYANKALDITKDVVDGMNANSKNEEEKKNK